MIKTNQQTIKTNQQMIKTNLKHRKKKRKKIYKVDDGHIK